MTGAQLTDLRQHTLAAVASGMTRRSAASRFGVSPSSVIRWVAEWHANGRDHALRQGGDRRSQWIEAWSGFLLAQSKPKAISRWWNWRTGWRQSTACVSHRARSGAASTATP
ncbi:helix-turn-helix domain-containing protein [Komagataeibacter oboediens]|nr:helix-turn-helix domain-containing protein [Komagataeibacter oboediens]